MVGDLVRLEKRVVSTWLHDVYHRNHMLASTWDNDDAVLSGRDNYYLTDEVRYRILLGVCLLISVT